MMNAFACLRREPELDEVINDPIVRLLMRQDGVTEADIRRLSLSVRDVDADDLADPAAMCGDAEA